MAAAEALPLVDGLALHPALAPLLPLWQSRRLAVALGVGWPRPNRSHFGPPEKSQIHCGAMDVSSFLG